MTVHSAMTAAELHESKGVDTATNRQVAVSDGAGSTTFQTMCRMGWANYHDVTTTGTPIALATAGTYFDLTNDGAGAQSDSTHELPEIGAIWNTSTDSLDLSNLEVGDTVDIRVDISVTTTGANHQIEIQLDMDTAPIAANFQLLIDRENFKASGTFSIIKYYSMYIGSTAVRDGLHKLRCKSDTGTADTVTVNGWYIRTIKHTDY